MTWFKSTSLYDYIDNGNFDWSLWYIKEMVYEDIASYCGMVKFASYNLSEESEIFMEFAEPQRIQKGLEEYNHSYDFLLWLLDKFSKQGLNEHVIIVEIELGKRNAEKTEQSKMKILWGLVISVLTTLFWSMIFSISNQADMKSGCK